LYLPSGLYKYYQVAKRTFLLHFVEK